MIALEWKYGVNVFSSASVVGLVIGWSLGS